MNSDIYLNCGTYSSEMCFTDTDRTSKMAVEPPVTAVLLIRWNKHKINQQIKPTDGLSITSINKLSFTETCHAAEETIVHQPFCLWVAIGFAGAFVRPDFDVDPLFPDTVKSKSSLSKSIFCLLKNAPNSFLERNRLPSGL